MKWNVDPTPSLALGPDLAAHQLGEPPADREPEAGAAVAARRGRVDLVNDSKSAVQRSAGIPIPVSRTEKRDAASTGSERRRGDGQHDLALLGELDRVVQQVQQDLAQPRGVADERLGHAGAST